MEAEKKLIKLRNRLDLIILKKIKNIIIRRLKYFASTVKTE